MKSNTLSVRRKPSDGHVSLLNTLQKSACPSPPASNTVQGLCCPHSQPETTFVFCMEIQNETGPGRAKLRRKSVDFRHVPQPRITRVFQNPAHASTMKHVCDAPLAEITLGDHEACCRGENIPATHLPAETSCPILV